MTRPRLNRQVTLRLECLEDRSVPATFHVTTTADVVDPADSKLSLREAISRANATVVGDVIVLPAGVFRITRDGAGENGNDTGDFDITDSVTITGAGRGLTFIDGQQLDRAFQVIGSAPGSIKVVLERMTVRNGKVDAPGGGIAVTNANLVVRDAAVTGNQATGATGNGGGIFGDSAAQIKLVRSTVARNTAGNFGGGIDASAATLLDSAVRRNISGGNAGGIGASTPTLTNCTVSGNTAGGNGGGVLAIGTATLTNCTVSGNTAGSFGGGISAGEPIGVSAGTATLTNSTVSGNSAGEGGGGISAFSATVTRSTVSGNASGDFGGGIVAFTATVTTSTVSNNAVTNSNGSGGGIFASGATLTKSNVSGNTSVGSGGGIRVATGTLTGCTIDGNRTNFSGGGIIVLFSATLTNTTIAGNSAGEGGGGVSTVGFFAASATLLNCTVVENLARVGGGLSHEPGGTFTVMNTIIALNLARPGGSGPDVFGTFTSQGHNLIGDGAGSSGFVGSGDIVGTSANPIDPKLGPLTNNGGPTKTHAILAGSRAIDAGDSAGVPATDQRGLPRKKDGNGDGVATVDIGAFER